MRVRIVKDWDHPNILRQTPGCNGVWDNIFFTENPFSISDVVTVLNVSPKNTVGMCRSGGLWLLSQEPPHEYYLWQTRHFNKYDRVYTFWNKNDYKSANIINAQTSLPWHINKTYDQLVELNTGQEFKADSFSWITSNLNSRPGHSLRLNFLKYIQDEKIDFPLFGRGFQPIEDKFNGIYPHKYSIAIENFSCNDYWTEKIADCFLSWTMPIYYGCLNIRDYFPKESMILIDPNNPKEALKTIQKAIDGNYWEKNLEFIKMSRDLILNQYQFFPSIAQKIKMSTLGSRRFFIFR